MLKMNTKMMRKTLKINTRIMKKIFFFKLY